MYAGSATTQLQLQQITSLMVFTVTNNPLQFLPASHSHTCNRYKMLRSLTYTVSAIVKNTRYAHLKTKCVSNTGCCIPLHKGDSTVNWNRTDLASLQNYEEKENFVQAITSVAWELIPFGRFEPTRVNTVRDQDRQDGAELAVSSLTVTIASAHCAYPRTEGCPS